MTDNKQEPGRYINSLSPVEKKRYYKIAMIIAKKKQKVEQDKKVRKHYERNWRRSRRRKEVRVYDLDIQIDNKN